MTVREITLDNILGTRLCGRLWHEGRSQKILALHGWLDNAATFDFLAPYLSDYEVLALDIIGHGRSAHKPGVFPYHFVDTVPPILGVADAMGWTRFILMGHSMGAGIGALVAGTDPKRLQGLVMLDALGPMVDEESAVPERLAAASRQMGADRKPMPLYPSTEAMVERLTASVKRLPRPAAAALVSRGHRLMSKISATGETITGYTWSADPKLRRTSPLRFTEGQVLAFLRRISCPMMVAWAEDGIELPRAVMATREQACTGLSRHVVAGGHHFHMEKPALVAEVLLDFLDRLPPGTL